MKGGTSLIAVILLTAQLSLAQNNVCDRIFDYSGVQEYLPFPLISEGLEETQSRELGTLYVPEIGLAFDVRHLMGAEYLVTMSDVWEQRQGRGVLVFADNTFSGFIEHDGENVLLDVGYVDERGRRQYYIQLDGKCFKADVENQRLR